MHLDAFKKKNTTRSNIAFFCFVLVVVANFSLLNCSRLSRKHLTVGLMSFMLHTSQGVFSASTDSALYTISSISSLSTMLNICILIHKLIYFYLPNCSEQHSYLIGRKVFLVVVFFFFFFLERVSSDSAFLILKIALEEMWPRRVSHGMFVWTTVRVF